MPDDHAEITVQARRFDELGHRTRKYLSKLTPTHLASGEDFIGIIKQIESRATGGIFYLETMMPYFLRADGHSSIQKLEFDEVPERHASDAALLYTATGTDVSFDRLMNSCIVERIAKGDATGTDYEIICLHNAIIMRRPVIDESLTGQERVAAVLGALDIIVPSGLSNHEIIETIEGVSVSLRAYLHRTLLTSPYSLRIEVSNHGT